jgi:hypothetical protein
VTLKEGLFVVFFIVCFAFLVGIAIDVGNQKEQHNGTCRRACYPSLVVFVEPYETDDKRLLACGCASNEEPDFTRVLIHPRR